MRLLVVVDTYVPARISGALQMRDLMIELVQQGHRPTVLVPGPKGLRRPLLETVDGVEVLRAPAPETKDVGLVRRTLSELWMPFALRRALRSSPLRNERWDGVIWYSPTIFLAPVVRYVKRGSRCRGYLILRDLFPDWAVDAGLMRRGGPAHLFFKFIERGQYATADVIGVQSLGNVAQVAADCRNGNSRIELLHNWLAAPVAAPCDIDLSTGPLKDRVIFAYTGNMGIAQGMDGIILLAERVSHRADIGFLFVGRGSEVPRLKQRAAERCLDNVLFLDEIESGQVADLLKQCHCGIVALDSFHNTHNVPGKLLTYLHAGLPVLARINPGNDLADLIRSEEIGEVVVGDRPHELVRACLALAESAKRRGEMAENGRQLVRRLFSPEAIALQIVKGLAGGAEGGHVKLAAQQAIGELS